MARTRPDPRKKQRLLCLMVQKNEKGSVYFASSILPGNQSFTALLSFGLCFNRKRIGFQHFAKISK